MCACTFIRRFVGKHFFYSRKQERQIYSISCFLAGIDYYCTGTQINLDRIVHCHAIVSYKSWMSWDMKAVVSSLKRLP